MRFLIFELFAQKGLFYCCPSFSLFLYFKCYNYALAPVYKIKNSFKAFFYNFYSRNSSFLDFGSSFSSCSSHYSYVVSVVSGLTLVFLLPMVKTFFAQPALTSISRPHINPATEEVEKWTTRTRTYFKIKLICIIFLTSGFSIFNFWKVFL